MSKKDPDILVGKKEINAIIGIKIIFYPNKTSGIGILEINGQQIHCLEREYRNDWGKIVRKIGELLGYSNAKI